MSIYQKLARVQKELQAPKERENKFGGYSYRSAEDILKAVKPELDKEGLTLLLSDEIVQIGERYYVRASVVLMDGEGAPLTTQALARECETKKGMDEAQITGAASSYARKYALCGMFAIDDSTQDPDSKEPETYRKQTEPKITQETRNKIVQKAQDLKIDNKRMSEIILHTFNKKSSKELTEKEAQTLLNELEANV